MDNLLNFELEENFTLRHLFTEYDLENIKEEILLLTEYVQQQNYSQEDLIHTVVNNLMSFELDKNLQLSSFFSEENIINFIEECTLFLV